MTTREGIAQLRLMRKTAVVLLLLLSTGRPMSARKIAEQLEIDYETTRKYLRSLAEIEMVTESAVGWLPTVGGQQLVMPGVLPAGTPAGLPERMPSGVAEQGATYSEEVIDGRAWETDQPPQSGAEIPRSAENPRARNPRCDEDACLLSSCKGHSVLIASKKEVCIKGLDSAEKPRRLRLGLPVGKRRRSALRALQELGVNRTPQVLELLDNPWVTAEYVRAIAGRLQVEKRFSAGLLLVCVRSHDPLPKAEGERRHRKINLTPPAPLPETGRGEREELTPLASLHEGQEEKAVPRSAEERAWGSVLEQLRREMPKGAFDTWVREARLVGVEGEVIQIEAGSAYAREWLSSRLKSTVTRLLTGMLNRSVVVEFVEVCDG